MPDANPQGRHPRNRRRAVRAAGQPVAAAGVRGAQRAGAGRARCHGQSRRTHGHRPRHPLPDFRGRRAGGPGRWRNTQRVNAFEPAAAGDCGGRPHRGARSDRRLARAARPPRLSTGREYATFGAPAPQRADRCRRGALVVIVVALLVLASVVSKIFGNVGGGLNKDELGLNGPSLVGASSAPSSAAAGQRRQTHQGNGLLPRRRRRQSGPGRAGDRRRPRTAWSTEVYTDAVPFPSFKTGRRVDVAAAQPHGGRPGHHRHARAPGPRSRFARPRRRRRRRSKTPPCWLRPSPLKPGHNVIPVRARLADVESAGVDLHAGNHQRQEPGQLLRDHGSGRILTALTAAPVG